MTIAHPMSLALALLLLGTMLFILRWRLTEMRLLPFAALLLAIATGGPTIHLRPAQTVTVMVDVSPSTRGGLYRSRSSLRHRVAELVGDTPIHWLQFSDRAEPLDMTDRDDTIAEMNCGSTILSPPANGPVLLFSDGVLVAPAQLPPIYPVIDPHLSDTHDAAVRQLAISGDQASATVSNDVTKTVLRWTGTSSSDIPVALGSTIMNSQVVGNEVTARVLAHDPWPENDSLSIIPAPNQFERWWVGENAPAGWKAVRPAELPNELQPLLSVSFIVLNNVAASEINAMQLSNIQNYIQNLGGGLLIIGGDHAFAAGGYGGTELQSLSPLSGYPPSPVTQWMVLIDRSGSMAAELSGVTRLQNATTAVAEFLPHLPPNDRASAAEFADAVTWIFENKPMPEATTAMRQWNGPTASGPTNLDAALRSIIATGPSALPRRILLLTDGETPLDHASELIQNLTSLHVRVDVLLLASASASPDLSNVVNSTGGRIRTVGDAGDWAFDLQSLAQSDAEHTFVHRDVPVRYRKSAQMTDRTVSGFNPTWTVDHAIALTDGDGPRAARWSFGVGAVGAVAFTPNATELATFEKSLAASPSDPDLQIDWLDGDSSGIRVDAKDGNAFENELKLSLSMGDSASIPIPLVAPGRYEASINAAGSMRTAVVRNGGRVIARRLIAGRYPQEFDRIGNDLVALQKIADRSGGTLIPPNFRAPIDFHWPEKFSSLSAWFAAAAAIVIGYACVVRRI